MQCLATESVHFGAIVILSQGAPTRTDRLGPAPGATAAIGSHSLTTGPRGHGSAAGPGELAPRSCRMGRPTWAGRLGPRTGAAAGLRPHSTVAQPLAKAEAAGRDWPTSRLGPLSVATPLAGTDLAPTRAVIRGHPTYLEPWYP